MLDQDIDLTPAASVRPGLVASSASHAAVTTIADGAAVRVPVPAALELNSEFVDDMVLIER